MEHCPECGAKLLADDQAHCHECGANLTLYESLVHADTASEERDDTPQEELQQAEFEVVSGKQDEVHVSAQSGSKQVHSREPIVYNLDELSGHEFEEAIATVFERLGYRTELPGKAADKGRDVIAERGGETLVVECKHQKGSVGRPVVQKLHSATSSYPGADRGLVITSGSFANTAKEHASKLKQAGDYPVELWDHDRLLKEARQADVYFTLGREGTEYIFRPELRSVERANQELWGRHLDGLESSPRDKQRAINAEHRDIRYTPGILVEFEVDERFSSQTYELYHAQARGRALFTLEEIDLSETEEEHWKSARYKVTCEETVNGRPAVSYFGQPLSQFKDRIATDVARRMSTKVQYTGRNNQTYTKRCEVDPADVSTDAKQVMLVHHEFELAVGPREHCAKVTADREQQWRLSRTEGFHDGNQDFSQGKGYVCNDCGLISPKSGDTPGTACKDCGRTLCSTHHWTWPRKAPFPSQDLCSECYQTKDHENQHLVTEGKFLEDWWKVALLGLLPGAAFLKAGRGLATLALLPLWLFYIGAPAFIAETGNVAGGIFWLTVAALISVSAALYWAKRVRRHRSNVNELEGYEPEWQPDPR